MRSPVVHRSVCDITRWPVGAFMVYDNAVQLRRWHPFPSKGKLHRAVGTVVHNDGDHTITVMWPENCKKRFCSYDVRLLNVDVIHFFPYEPPAFDTNADT